MKRLGLVLLFAFVFIMTYGQQVQDTVKVEYEWARIASSGIVVSYSLHRGGPIISLPKEIDHSLELILEYLQKDGWEYVQTIVFPNGTTSTYIKRKKIIQDNEAY